MPFKLLPVKQLKAKVVFERPLDFGKTQKEDCVVTYKKLDKDELKPMLSQLEAAQKGEDDKDDFEFLRQYVVNIEEIQDENGEPVEYTETILKEMLQENWMSMPLVMTFVNLQFQEKVVQEKN